MPAASPAREARRGFVTGLPVTAAFIPFGLVLGASAAQKGLSMGEVFLMTALNFAGGSEMAVIQVWTWPPNILLIALITLLINSRHILMGATLVPYLRSHSRRNCLIALYIMCDESWAVAHADIRRRLHLPQHACLSLPFYFGVAASMYVTWFTSCTLGACIGPVLGDIRVYGLQMAIPAVFLVILRGLWPGVRHALPWLASLAAAGLTWRAFPGAWYILAGSVAGIAAAWLQGEKKNG